MQTVQGWFGPDLVTERADVPGACQAMACAAIDKLLVTLAVKAAADHQRKRDWAG